MKLKDVLKPRNIFILILCSQLLIYLLFYIGIIHSFKIKYISKNIFGYILFITIYLMLIIISSFKYKKQSFMIKVRKVKKIYINIYILTFISILGLLGITQNMIKKIGFKGIKAILFTNATKDHLIFGSGYIPMCSMSIIAITLLVLIWNNNKKNKVLIGINFLVIIISGILLNARILIIQPILYSLLIFIRKNIYNLRLPKIKLSVFILVLGIILIITSGLRDYEAEGKYYTDSKILWGISRIIDYPITTTNYSLEILNTKVEKIRVDNLFEILKRFNKKSVLYKEYDGNLDYIRKMYGSPEYTNLGGVGQVYYNSGLISIIILFIYGILVVYSYNSYHSGKLFGVMTYPLIYYSILEFWRVFIIGTELFCINLIGIIIVYFFIKDCFYYEEYKI